MSTVIFSGLNRKSGASCPVCVATVTFASILLVCEDAVEADNELEDSLVTELALSQVSSHGEGSLDTISVSSSPKTLSES